MDAKLYKRMHELFHEALSLPESERKTFLELKCEGDSELFKNVLALLESDSEVESLLDNQISEIAYQMFEGSHYHPETIGSYRIIKVLGKGGMGVVYLAKHRHIDRFVALKLLRDAQLSEARKQRFEIEKQILAQLDHPNIARLIDADVLPDGTPYFIMEYVDGSTIVDFFQNNEKFKISTCLKLLLLICNAISFAHSKSIIHRDLKPSNIFVNNKGNIKLLDFGIAKQADLLKSSDFNTETGYHLMTPAYAAPEQVINGSSSVQTDVFSLGVVLFQILTDKLPLDNKRMSAGQFLKNVQNLNSYKEADTINRARDRFILDVGSIEDLKLLCSNAMHGDPERRYSNIEVFMADIKHFLNNEPLESRADTAVYKIKKFIHKNKKVAVTTFVFLCIIIGSLTYYSFQVTKQKKLAEQESLKANQIINYLIDLFDEIDPYEAEYDIDGIEVMLQKGINQADALKNQPAIQADLYDVFGRVYTSLSKYDKAEVYLRRAYKIRDSLFFESVDLSETMTNMGILHLRRGEFDSAEGYLRNSMQILNKFSINTKPQLATTMENLGVALTNQGNYQEGEESLREALKLKNSLYSKPHKMITSGLNNLAVNLMYQGKYEESEKYFRESIDQGKKVYGENHLNIATDLSNLGVILDIIGDHSGADSALTEAIEIKRENLGNYHYETSFSLMQLGGILQRAGNLQRAEKILLDALGINKEILPPEHRNNGVINVYLGGVYQEQQNYDKAEKFYKEAFKILTGSLGKEHEFTATTQCRLANMYHQSGKFLESKKLFSHCIAILEEIHGSEHDVVASFKTMSGDLFTSLGEYQSAEPLLVSGYNTIKSKFGKNHRDTKRAAERLYRYYSAVGDKQTAASYKQN